MVNLIWSELALDDLRNIYNFIAIDSAHYARLQIDRIIERTNQLIQFPNSGRVVPEFNLDTLRELIEGSYRIVYAKTDRQIEIVRIHHTSKLLDSFA